MSKPKTSYSSHATLSKKGKRIYIQDLRPYHYNVSALCKSANNSRSSKRNLLSKTPVEDPGRCLWRARIGNNPKYLYFSVRMRVKNPHYKGTGNLTGGGYHWQNRWKLVYDKRTDKAFDAKKHMSAFLRGRLT